MARQFNLIPPVCEQAEYHLFQREKVEIQLPELYHKIGKCVCVCVQLDFFSFHLTPRGFRDNRSRGHDVVAAGLRRHHGKI